jgi:hypothetical protein
MSIMVPAHGIEVDKIDYMVCVPLSSKKPLSHNGFEFNGLAEALFDPGYLDRTEIAGLKNRCANVHMRAAIGSLCRPASPQLVPLQ